MRTINQTNCLRLDQYKPAAKCKRKMNQIYEQVSRNEQIFALHTGACPEYTDANKETHVNLYTSFLKDGDE